MTSNQKALGSIPSWDLSKFWDFFNDSAILFYVFVYLNIWHPVPSVCVSSEGVRV